MLTYIELDGTRIEFINGKPPIQRQKQKARGLSEDMLYQEQFTLNEYHPQGAFPVILD